MPRSLGRLRKHSLNYLDPPQTLLGRGGRSQRLRAAGGRPGHGAGGIQHRYAGSHTELGKEVYIVYTGSVGAGPTVVL